MAIARFVAHRCNLAGSDDLSQAKADAIADTCLDLMNVYIDKVLHASDDQRNDAKVKFMGKDAPEHLTKIEKLIGLYGSKGFSVGSTLTWADLAIHDIISTLLEKQADCLDKFFSYFSCEKIRGSRSENRRVFEK